ASGRTGSWRAAARNWSRASATCSASSPCSRSARTRAVSLSPDTHQAANKSASVLSISSPLSFAPLPRGARLGQAVAEVGLRTDRPAHAEQTAAPAIRCPGGKRGHRGPWSMSGVLILPPAPALRGSLLLFCWITHEEDVQRGG